jgi:hypothetical protein
MDGDVVLQVALRGEVVDAPLEDALDKATPADGEIVVNAIPSSTGLPLSFDAELTAPPEPHLLQLFPLPWERDLHTRDVPPSRRCCIIYAADSMRICETRGEHADALARMIVNAVNAWATNTEHEAGRRASDAELMDPPEDEWRAIEDENVRHVWVDDETQETVAVSPDFYEENGEPCSESDGSVLRYLRTEICSGSDWREQDKHREAAVCDPRAALATDDDLYRKRQDMIADGLRPIDIPPDTGDATKRGPLDYILFGLLLIFVGGMLFLMGLTAIALVHDAAETELIRAVKEQQETMKEYIKQTNARER